jgi:diacylglycerol kinase (ATP)
MQEPRAPKAAARWLLIVNPAAGRGAAGRSAQRLPALLTAAGLRFDLATTAGRGHAIALARAAVLAGHRHLVAVGGDGTVNEVVNGVCSQDLVPTDELTLAVVPAGTGNDLSRSLRMPDDPRRAVRTIAEGYAVMHGIGSASYEEGGTARTRCFVNMAGCGIDTQILRRLGDRKAGHWAYRTAVLRTLLAPPALPLRVRSAESSLMDEVVGLFAGFGPYCGGGMRVAVAASRTALGVTMIRAMPRMRLLMLFARLQLGKPCAGAGVTAWQTAGIEIHNEVPAEFQLDGELVGAMPLRLSVRARGINMVCSSA